MAIDAVNAVHSSPVAQSIEAVENALRNPNPQRHSSALPQDKVTISPAAQAKQPASAGDKQLTAASNQHTRRGSPPLT